MDRLHHIPEADGQVARVHSIRGVVLLHLVQVLHCY